MLVIDSPRAIIHELRSVSVEPDMWDLENCELDVNALVKVVSETNANAIRVGFFGHTGLAYYPSQIAPRHPHLGERDLLGEFQESCKRHGIELIVYMNVSFDMSMYHKHPEWITQIKGVPSVEMNAPFARMCLDSPYLDYVMSIHREIVERYRPQVLYFDTFKVHLFCTNQYTKQALRRDRNIDVPSIADWHNPDWIEYVDWRQEHALDIARKLVGNVKRPNPDAVVIFNRESFCNVITSTPEENAVLAHQVADNIHAEAAVRMAHEEFWHINQQCLFGQAMKTPIWLWVESNNGNWIYTSVPPQELTIKTAIVLANGGRPNIWCLPWAPSGDVGALDAVRDIYRRVSDHGNAFDHTETCADTAIVVSTLSRRYYTKGCEPTDYPYEVHDDQKRFQDETDGFTKLCLYSHQLLTYQLDGDVTHDNLKRFKVLILPNVGAISQDTADEIKLYVHRGGSVLATYQTSLFDINGSQRNDFALSELFGASYAGEAQSIGDNDTLFKVPGYLSIDDNCPFATEKGLVPAAGRATKVVANTATVIGRIAYPGPYHVAPRPPVSDIPGLLCREYGAGRVVYCPYEFGFAYLNEEPLQTLQMFRQLIVWLRRGKMTIESNMPALIQVSIRLTTAGDLVVHLIPTPGRRPAPDGHALAATDVEIILHLGELIEQPMTLKRVGGTSSGFRYDIDTTSIRLYYDVIKDYEVVIIEGRKANSP